ncbi:MAG: Fe-S cluster assembly protein SufD [Oligoflexia bacterium]|nr:Fe-S cluster assembly protein SufD [Oligoflexia bacterium]
MTQTDWVSQNFLAFERGLNGSAHAPLHQLRKDAFQRFAALGFPSASAEEWRKTDLSAIRGGKFEWGLANTTSEVAESDLRKIMPGPFSAHVLVFFNGRFVPALSTSGKLPAGVKLSPLADYVRGTGTDSELSNLVRQRLGSLATFTDQAFVALNTAFLNDGVVLSVARGVELQESIQIAWISDGSQTANYSTGRCLIALEEGASARVIETWSEAASDRQIFCNHVTEVFVADGAMLDHVKVLPDSAQALHVGRLVARVGSKSNLHTGVFSFGGAMVRNEICPELAGANSNCVMHGLTVVGGSQHVDNFTVLDHAQPNCESRELYKGVYGDKASGVFSGTIIVRPGAQKTNALQTNQSVLLSPTASIDTQPQLKIWADDVKCTHGATVGQLDEQALFYVRSRGVPFADARDMLVHAFASDIVNSVSTPALRDYLENQLMKKLGSFGIHEER